MAGLLDLLSTRIENKLLRAKMDKNTLKAMQGLMDQFGAIQQNAGNIDSQAARGAFQLTPSDQESPMPSGIAPTPFRDQNAPWPESLTPAPPVPNTTQTMADMPGVQPVKPAKESLLDALLPILAQSNPTAAAQVLEQQTDPKTQLIKGVISRLPNMIGGPAMEGGGGVAPGSEGGLGSLILQMAQNDPAALAAGPVLKMSGIDTAPFVQASIRAKAQQFTEQKYMDEITKLGEGYEFKSPEGTTYVQYRNKHTKQPIPLPADTPNMMPGGWFVKEQAPLVREEIKGPGGETRAVWMPKTAGINAGTVISPPQLRPIQEEIAGGGVVEKTIPMTQPYSIMVKQPASMMPIPADELTLYVHPDTLETARAGMTPKQAETVGMQRLSTSAKQKVDAFKGAQSILTESGIFMDKIFPEKESMAAPGRAMRPLAALIQSDANKATFRSLVEGTLAPIIRALGEKGALSDADTKRAMSLMPTLSDRASVARMKFKAINNIIEKAQRSVFSPVPGSKSAQKKETADEVLERLKKQNTR